ncbi:hypothetical protein VP01_930g4 [Puccinia sorghi]|uniref:Uncharacterized protein n=1 Tax=Puccinia sorghi TaxID=27349 RepID=A0A0L6U6Z8_9BASI|nr:hypothetical protein VP01_930g4 [Puccinia sorghi]
MIHLKKKVGELDYFLSSENWYVFFHFWQVVADKSKKRGLVILNTLLLSSELKELSPVVSGKVTQTPPLDERNRWSVWVLVCVWPEVEHFHLVWFSSGGVRIKLNIFNAYHTIILHLTYYKLLIEIPCKDKKKSFQRKMNEINIFIYNIEAFWTLLSLRLTYTSILFDQILSLVEFQECFFFFFLIPLCPFFSGMQSRFSSNQQAHIITSTQHQQSPGTINDHQMTKEAIRLQLNQVFFFFPFLVMESEGHEQNLAEIHARPLSPNLNCQRNSQFEFPEEPSCIAFLLFSHSFSPSSFFSCFVVDLSAMCMKLGVSNGCAKYYHCAESYLKQKLLSATWYNYILVKLWSPYGLNYRRLKVG